MSGLHLDPWYLLITRFGLHILTCRVSRIPCETLPSSKNSTLVVSPPVLHSAYTAIIMFGLPQHKHRLAVYVCLAGLQTVVFSDPLVLHWSKLMIPLLYELLSWYTKMGLCSVQNDRCQ